jgi:hypothetical protein
MGRVQFTPELIIGKLRECLQLYAKQLLSNYDKIY